MTLDELIQQEGKRIEKARGEHLFLQGNADQSLYYVESGLLKAYYTSEDGQESIKSFLQSGDAIGSMTSAFSAGSCSFSLLCLEDSSLITLPFATLQALSKTDLKLANNLIELLVQLAMKKEEREYEFLCLSAEDRLRKLMEGNAGLINRVTQNDLARYLGVTPVGLSRIKKRILADGA